MITSDNFNVKYPKRNVIRVDLGKRKNKDMEGKLKIYYRN